MFEKIKHLAKHPYVKLVSDSRSLGLIAFGVVALLVTWSGMKAVQTNYELQKQIARQQQLNKVSQLENDNQKLKNEYYKSDEFLELAARRQFGKAAPGETLYIVPKSVALAHTKDLSKETSKKTNSKSDSKAVSHKPTYQKNFEAWVNFFLRRSDHAN